ncbi:MAG: RtcB family protein [Clostridia bacterium]|nr:RtcB family protein [Clostridia bacterium]
MIELIGRYNTAKCFAFTMGELAREQILAICNQSAFSSAKIRIMPDVHEGTGCTIGTTLTVTDKVVPFMVGVDIGCGMYTVCLGKQDVNLPRLDAAAHAIPSGRSVWDSVRQPFDLLALRCYPHLKDVHRLGCGLGTLGGGNHFIEVDEDGEGNKYLVVHSGSRNLGVQVASYYQQVAIDLNLGKKEFFAARADMIECYKKEGKEKQIQAELKRLDRAWAQKKPTLPRELCYLYGEEMQDYLHDIAICQQYAEQNRMLIASILLEACGLTATDSFTTVHNYIDVKNRILRKGAVSAQAGERLLIPINMRDGSLICTGKGNEDWNFSAPHGAGRLMSRAAAMQRLSLEEYKAQMSGIYSTCVLPSTLDESPMAYKSLEEITEGIAPTADIVCRIKPIYNFKATE